MRYFIAIVSLGLFGVGVGGCVSESYPVYESAEPAAYYPTYAYYPPPVHQVQPVRRYHEHWRWDRGPARHDSDDHRHGRPDDHDGYGRYDGRR